MDNTIAAARLLEQMRADIKESLERMFTMEPNDKTTRYDMVAYIRGLLSMREGVDLSKVEVQVNTEEADSAGCIIEPKNLYTMLLLHGVNVGYEEVAGLREYKTEYGTWVYDEVTGGGFIPNDVERIEVKIGISKDGLFVIDENTQRALDWWNELPMQNLMDGRNGWANLCMIYYPDRTDCQGLTNEEILHIYEQEHKK